MISKISELMYKEHSIVLEGISIATSLDKSWEINAVEYESNVKWLIAFFKEYADQYHHYKEEEILFPALMKTEEPSVMAIIGELIEHHEEFREIVGNIKADIEENKYSEVQQKLNTYCHDLLDHIAAENEELFPMADTLLSEDDLEKLYYKCLDKDNELGATRKEELENFIKNFNYKQDEIVR